MRKNSLSPSSSIGRSIVVPLLGLFFVLALLISYIAFVLSLFVPHLSFFWRLGKAKLRDFGIFWVSTYLGSVEPKSTYTTFP